jgi:hypothetical protein
MGGFTAIKRPAGSAMAIGSGRAATNWRQMLAAGAADATAIRRPGAPPDESSLSDRLPYHLTASTAKKPPSTSAAPASVI